ncbi:hypothetical protein [Myxococcus qinghaiensis]|uniref:hypothetical protein n=1 Tax=Myxococcus qinghaiensis TaxID=2906758 RepID=UPI0020A7F2B1|nr:hypothetical protein [Myxococcus qinghaiensis]MCP3164871.1 hypothetical protein [Myxococcus qinghaiensis]
MSLFQLHIERAVHVTGDKGQTEARLAGWVGPFKVPSGPHQAGGGGWYRGSKRGERIIISRDIPLGEYLVSRIGTNIESRLELLSDGGVRLVTKMRGTAALRCVVGALGAAAAALVLLKGTLASWGVVTLVCLGVAWFFYAGGRLVRRESDALTAALEHLIQ